MSCLEWLDKLLSKKLHQLIYEHRRYVRRFIPTTAATTASSVLLHFLSRISFWDFKASFFMNKYWSHIFKLKQKVWIIYSLLVREQTKNTAFLDFCVTAEFGNQWIENSNGATEPSRSSTQLRGTTKEIDSCNLQHHIGLTVN